MLRAAVRAQSVLDLDPRRQSGSEVVDFSSGMAFEDLPTETETIAG